MSLSLRPFGAADLPSVEPWFDDGETRRWLGGRGWPAMILRANALLPAARTFLALEGPRAVALAGWDIEAEGRAGLAFVVAPEARGRGIGTAALALSLAHPEAAGARRFVAGVEEGNAPSEALLRRLGFRPEGERDAEGFLHLARPGPAA